MRVLITGGAGFIGSRLALKLVEQGCKVTVLDNLNPQIHGIVPENSYTFKTIFEKVLFVRGDVCIEDDLAKVIPSQDVILMLHSETGTGQSMYQIRQYSMTNIQGTAQILDFLVNKKHSVKKVVIASSRAVYGEGKYNCLEHGNVYPDPRRESDMIKGNFELKCPHCYMDLETLPTDEESHAKPSSVYGITKYAQEKLVLNVCRSIGICAIALRYQNVFGPGQSLNNPYTGILSIFASAMCNGKKINIFEDGQESRDFIYIEDAVSAINMTLKNDSLENHTINVGTGVRITVLQVLKELSRALNIPANYNISGNFRIGDIRHNCADITIMKNLLKFIPKWSFSEGIQMFTNWVRTEKKFNSFNRSLYKESLEELQKKKLLK